MSDLVREFDSMIAMLVTYDNQSRNQCLTRESGEIIEKMRDIIKKFVESEVSE